MKEYIFENAIVRIHDGSRSEEERKVALENAAKTYIRQIRKKNPDFDKRCSLFGSDPDGDGGVQLCGHGNGQA